LRIHSQKLAELMSELYSDEERAIFGVLSSDGRLDLEAFAAFDYSLGGPSVLTIADPRLTGGTLNMPGQGVGRYSVADRDVFRQLQYCAAYLTMVDERAVWLARSVVELSSAHIEALVKRIGRLRFLPLGTMLRKKAVAAAIDSTTLDQTIRFTPIYNASKHDFSQAKDTHMFSLEDALMAYFICRRLAQRLYPLAHIETDMRIFNVAPAVLDPLSGHLLPHPAKSLSADIT
jgi:hypothetical protein